MTARGRIFPLRDVTEWSSAVETTMTQVDDESPFAPQTAQQECRAERAATECRLVPQASRTLALVLLALGASAVGLGRSQEPAPEEPEPLPLEEQINQAIDRGVLNLRRQQHRDGSWSGSTFAGYRTGPTALSAYALVESGVSPTSSSIQHALEYIRHYPPNKTYSTGATLMLLAEIHGRSPLDEANVQLAEGCLEKLVDWESARIRGTWGYPEGQVDLSNTQFAAMGFWGAHLIGLEVPTKTLQRMVMATIDRHQEEATIAEGLPAPKKGRSRSGGRKMAGYSYLVDGRDEPRGSMTVAGLCVQLFAERIRGRKLGRKVLVAKEKSVPLGMTWLEAHWSVERNPGPKPNYQHFYYLWGIERLGALLETDKLFGHDWYREGATRIVELQKGDGAWGAQLHETCYALLFLSRATGAAMSGERPASAPSGWNQTTGPIQLRAVGHMTIDSWITSMSPDLVIRSVNWLVDGKSVSRREFPKGNKVSKNGHPETRLTNRWLAERSGKKIVAVQISCDGADGTVGTRTITSEALAVEAQWDPSAWSKRAFASRATASHSSDNLILPGDQVTVSTAAASQDALRAIDGLEGTAWRPDGADEAPWIEVSFDRKLSASRLTLSHPASSVAQIKTFGSATRIRVSINGGEPSEFDLLVESPEAFVLPLPETKRVKVLRIEILEGAGSASGFAEVGLLP